MAKKKPRPAFDQISIEIFAAAKSCDQGCPPCPLANRSNPITAKVVDANVQQTFSLLESALSKAKARYDLHLSSTFDLIPVLNHPDIINMARFTTNKTIHMEGNAQKFANDIKETVTKRGIDPKVIGYSVVAASPAVSEVEINLIREINQAISEWYFKSQYREIQVTIRSNLIKSALYDQILPQVFVNDTTLVKNLAEEFANKPKHIARVSDQPDCRFYAMFYEGVNKKRKITIHNRVITSKNLPNTCKALIDQAWSLYPFNSHDIQDFAIAPKGVMLMHSSLAINNPLLWITHNDFRDSLEWELKTKKKFNSLNFLRKLMKENHVMYMIFTKQHKESGDTSPMDFMKSYEKSRFHVRHEYMGG